MEIIGATVENVSRMPSASRMAFCGLEKVVFSLLSQTRALLALTVCCMIFPLYHARGMKRFMPLTYQDSKDFLIPKRLLVADDHVDPVAEVEGHLRAVRRVFHDRRPPSADTHHS